MDQEINMNTRNRDESEIEIDLIDLLMYYQTKLVLIIGAFIIGALIAGLVTRFLMTPKFTATSTMYMVSSTSDSVVDLSDLNIGTTLSEDYVELIKTRPIVEGVADELKLDYTYEQLMRMIDLKVLPNTRIIKISVTSPDKFEARDVANALAIKAETELPKLMDAPKPNIAEKAIVPEHKSSPSLTKNTMIGALLAMLAVLAVLTVLYIMDDTLKTADDVEKNFGVMPLTTIPEGNIHGRDGSTEGKAEKRGLLSRLFGRSGGKRHHKYKQNKKGDK
ncbi:MAG: capsular polysaccharide biosynthesis protein [Eubacterium sp.]|nr:capsular polysaccharide biosynthesis protein [Eubacterium sp.]